MLVVSGQTDFAIVASDHRHLDSGLMLAADLAGVRVVALVGSAADRRYARSLGLWETAESSCSWSELETAMLGAVAFSLPVPAEFQPGDTAGSASGQVIAVWGPAGSPGRTTLAIALAAELAAAGNSVVLADVDTQSGSVALSLGMINESPGLVAACQLAGTGSLTPAHLDCIANRYESLQGGFRVLTGIDQPSRWPELSSEQVKSTIEACREWVDFVILDTGASLENDDEKPNETCGLYRNAATITAIREGDLVLAIGSADSVGLSRFIRAFSVLRGTLHTDQVTVVINRIRASAVGMNAAAQVRQTLERCGGIRSPWLIPNDPISLDAAVLSGRTLLDVAPRSSARLAISCLVAELFGVAVAAPKRRGRSSTS